jgi:hypothetical protein
MMRRHWRGARSAAPGIGRTGARRFRGRVPSGYPSDSLIV